ncbi:tyrosine-protein phosphatase [Halobacillus karajensis]|uniref:Tyrosine-protein phosphatase n=1 Tax=Halobacillus karajensis TaxID=195088 RepID=A0A059NWT4_9BACI|nr:CpsB/CapC family capsule biosynthesis tyrosine phosphatase [Halobacillus karajensis]CDQ18943.1 Tyrosine-protein phosphatase YwqE [Halobacillus karajensis]CDQ22984.1 Tyrosine-protein phosphatase YwqE [Halobacillus karajensis]CDQ26466.1 Tyrosine-protein phosphatase YwqE [Halobacillus karajensis]
MIDIHSHILPGVDDGAQTIEESIAMAEAAVADGIDTIIATPHHKNGVYDNFKYNIKIQVAELNRTFQERGIELHVLPGQETRIYGEMVEGINQDEILMLNEHTSYMFVEFPSDSVPRYASQLFFDLQVAGVQPIIVHPERNKQLIEHPDQLYSFVKQGAFCQLTAASITGQFGKKIKKFSEQLIEANLAHLIASDAHNITSRGFCMTDAYAEIRKQYGLDMVYLLSENAEDVVAGNMLAAEPPEHIRKKKKLFGIFGS